MKIPSFEVMDEAMECLDVVRDYREILAQQTIETRKVRLSIEITPNVTECMSSLAPQMETNQQ